MKTNCVFNEKSSDYKKTFLQRGAVHIYLVILNFQEAALGARVKQKDLKLW